MSGAASPSKPVLDMALAAAPDERARLLLALAKLCDLPEAGETERARDLIESLFMELIEGAERSIRLHLAEALAPARWAPSALVNTLALDDIDIARPIIAKSPILKDEALLRLLVLGTLEHQIEIARRPNLGSAVVDRIVAGGEPSVLAALASNDSAEASEDAMARLVAASRHVAAMRAPLSRHPRLTSELASLLYTWVGESLQRALAQRFTIDPTALEKAVGEAVKATHEGRPLPALAIRSDDLDRQEMETRLVAKLQAAGQLRPGFLLRSLREGKLHLFELALASLAHLRSDDMRTVIDSDRPDMLALACAGVGIDRSVFPSLLSLVRNLNHGRPVESDRSSALINNAFQKSSIEALEAFRAAVESERVHNANRNYA